MKENSFYGLSIIYYPKTFMWRLKNIDWVASLSINFKLNATQHLNNIIFKNTFLWKFFYNVSRGKHSRGHLSVFPSLTILSSWEVWKALFICWPGRSWVWVTSTEKLGSQDTYREAVNNSTHLHVGNMQFNASTCTYKQFNILCICTCTPKYSRKRMCWCFGNTAPDHQHKSWENLSIVSQFWVLIKINKI